MTGLTINNYSILKTSGGELEFLQFYKLPKYKQIRNVPHVKSQFRNEFTT